MLPCAFLLLESSLAKRFMDRHPLANLFKRSNYDEPIVSEFCALDYFMKFCLKFVNLEIVMRYFMK